MKTEHICHSQKLQYNAKVVIFVSRIRKLMTENQFIPKPYTNFVDSGSVTWQSPSNIALVKYWGKKQHQLPEN